MDVVAAPARAVWIGGGEDGRGFAETSEPGERLAFQVFGPGVARRAPQRGDGFGKGPLGVASGQEAASAGHRRAGQIRAQALGPGIGRFSARPIAGQGAGVPLGVGARVAVLGRRGDDLDRLRGVAEMGQGFGAPDRLVHRIGRGLHRRGPEAGQDRRPILDPPGESRGPDLIHQRHERRVGQDRL